MPVLRNHTVLSIARGIKAFLNLEAGVTRSGVPGRGSPARQGKGRTVSSGGIGGVRPENMVWVFGYGSGRSGTTWLGRMFHDLSGCSLWSSPRVGDLFGHFYYKHISTKRNFKRKEHIMGAEKDAWLAPMRSFILDSANARYPRFIHSSGEDRYLVVNEIHGSLGAPLIMEALPESRMILMMRDPRDVAASVLDGSREGSWSYETTKRLDKGDSFVAGDPVAQVKRYVENNLETMNNARQAYDNHKGPKTILKYEDLREDALGAMKRAVSELGLPVDEEELARVVEKHSWENVPADQKGEGKFYRKAAPGSWREDLAPEEIEMIEKGFKPLIEEFYSQS